MSFARRASSSFPCTTPRTSKSRSYRASSASASFGRSRAGSPARKTLSTGRPGRWPQASLAVKESTGASNRMTSCATIQRTVWAERRGFPSDFHV